MEKEYLDHFAALDINAIDLAELAISGAILGDKLGLQKRSVIHPAMYFGQSDIQRRSSSW